jgi:hypothetical protein
MNQSWKKGRSTAGTMEGWVATFHAITECTISCTLGHVLS